MQNEITDKMVEAFGYKFWPVNATSKIMGQREEIRSALSAALAAAEAKPVAWMSEDKWCVITDRQLKNVPELSDPTPLYPIPIYAYPPVASTALTVDEVEKIIIDTEPLTMSDKGDKIWTRRMAGALASKLNAMLAARPTPSVDTEARRMALEEAAEVADKIEAELYGRPGEGTAARIAAAIRALIPQEGKADA